MDIYLSMSFIQPMFHLKLKPRPPISAGFVTIGHAVDSSAIIMMFWCSRNSAELSFCRNATASRFSWPP